MFVFFGTLLTYLAKALAATPSVNSCDTERIVLVLQVNNFIFLCKFEKEFFRLPLKMLYKSLMSLKNRIFEQYQAL